MTTASSSTRIEGSVFALARWFQPERYANRPEDDFLREDILNDVYVADRVGISDDGTVFVRSPNGACAITTDEDRGIVSFDYVSSSRWERTSFWMNESSVRDLLETLLSLPRVSADDLFSGSPAAATCPTCTRPVDDGYVNVAADEACMDRCHGRTSRLATVAEAYQALCREAEALGIPTSLTDPASPTTVVDLRHAVVDALRRAELERPAQYRSGLAARRRRIEQMIPGQKEND